MESGFAKNCAKLIDSDTLRYDETKLRDWKRVSENRTIRDIEGSDFKADTTSFKEKHTKWILVLSATIKEIDRRKAEAIVKHLQKLSGDTSLTLFKIEEGSILFTIESSLDGFERVRSLFRSGLLKDIEGIPIKEVRLKGEVFEQVTDLNFTVPDLGKISSLDSIEFLDLHPCNPLVLLIDVSGSMAGEPIQTLNEGLKILKEELMKDELARKRIEIALITFGTDVSVKENFTSIRNFSPLNLFAEGARPTGSAINKALEIIQEREQKYASEGIYVHRPIIFLIAGGEPTDNWKTAANNLKELWEKKRITFFGVGIGEESMEVLSKISSFRQPKQLKEFKFNEMFKWLSGAMKSIVYSGNTPVSLESTSDWAKSS